MEIALATLLVSSLSSVGLLALWAATSQRHWFLRTAVFLSVISLLLLVPAIDPWYAFLVEGLVVLAGTRTYLWWTREDGAPPRTSFSIATLLQVTAVIAVVTALLAGTYQENEGVLWKTVVPTGLYAGFLVLIVAWLIHGRARLWNRILASLGSVVVSTVFIWWWEPSEISLILSYGDTSNFFSSSEGWSPSQWLLLTSCIICLLVIALRIQRREQNLLLFLFVAILATPSIYVYCYLMNPTPMPATSLPSPNGYDTLVRAATEIECREISFYDETAIEVLKSAVEERAELYLQAEEALMEDVMVPLDYSYDDIDTDAGMALRNLMRAFAAQSRVSVANRDYDRALKYEVLSVELGTKSSQGGVLIHWLIGTAIKGDTYRRLYEMLDRLNAEQCLALSSALTKFEIGDEEFASMLHRERIWSEHALGYTGHLPLILMEMLGEDYFGSLQIEKVRNRGLVESRLLRCELALHAFKQREKRYPRRLSELVPDYIPKVPIDPFDPNSERLQYRKKDEGYELYSVGPNEIDEYGEMQLDPNSYSVLQENGDYRLDVVFGDVPNDAQDPNSTVNDPNAPALSE